MAERATHLRSIQGELQRDAAWVRATEADVDANGDGASPEVLACRRGATRSRPTSPARRWCSPRSTAMGCSCAGCAVQAADSRTEWRSGRESGAAGAPDSDDVTARLDYLTGPNGETFLAPPGQGRMTPRQIADSVATMAMQGQV